MDRRAMTAVFVVFLFISTAAGARPEPEPLGDRPTDWPTCVVLGANVSWGGYSNTYEFYFPFALAAIRTVTGVVVETAAGAGTTTTIHVAVYSDDSGPDALQTTGSLADVDGSTSSAHLVDVENAVLPVGSYWLGFAISGSMWTPTCEDSGAESFFFGDEPFDAAANPFTATPPGSTSGPYSSSANNWGRAYVHAVGFPGNLVFEDGFEAGTINWSEVVPAGSTPAVDRHLRSSTA